MGSKDQLSQRRLSCATKLDSGTWETFTKDQREQSKDVDQRCGSGSCEEDVRGIELESDRPCAEVVAVGWCDSLLLGALVDDDFVCDDAGDSHGGLLEKAVVGSSKMKKPVFFLYRVGLTSLQKDGALTS